LRDAGLRFLPGRRVRPGLLFLLGLPAEAVLPVLRHRFADHGDLAGQFGDRDPAFTLASMVPARPPAAALAAAVAGEKLGNGHRPTVRLAHRAPTNSSPPISVSSRRRISPSRNAHGHICIWSTDSARILASATSAPATSCGDLSALTPSSSARSAAVILEINAISCRSPPAVSVRLTRGPALEGAAPVSLASVRKVLEVPTHR